MFAPPFNALALQQLEAAVFGAINAGRLPGAVLHIESDGQLWQRAIGHKALVPAPEPLDAQTVYDVASLTKVMVTAPVLMKLAEGGVLDLDAPVRHILPAFHSPSAGNEPITVRQLLTHGSGLPASLPLHGDWQGPEAALALACASEPTHAPDRFFRYSDINFILLGEIARLVGGQPLDRLAAQWFFEPLAMNDTLFCPLQRHTVARIAPTEVEVGTTLRGVVHDPTARRMGGVAGHAGLFSTAADVARYARCLLAGGTLGGVPVLKESSVAQMTSVASAPGLPALRGLGWDIDSPYSRPRGRLFPVGSYGHTGFTGCVLWINPGTHSTPGSFHIFLSNRVHPSTRESIVDLYEDVGTLAAQAVGLG